MDGESLRSTNDPEADFRSSKVMYCTFFDGYGPNAQIIALKGQTITWNFNTNQRLREIEQRIINEDLVLERRS